MSHDDRALPPVLAVVDLDGALAEVAERAVPTRRGLLRVAAGGTIGGMLASSRSARATGASRQDINILNYALGLEYVQASFYTEAERFGALRGQLAHQARVVGAHERAHVEAFQKVLGTAAIKRPRFDFRGVTEDPDGFRRTAVAFEDLAVAAYKYQAPRIQSRAYLMAAISIHSVEARHAAWVRKLAGVLPAASPFDQPLAPHEVNALIASTHFIVGKPDTTSHRPPKYTG